MLFSTEHVTCVSCCIDNHNLNFNERAGAGIEARDSVRTVHQFTVNADPALVTSTSVGSCRHWKR